MTSVPSATTWGSPIATQHALLIHGLTSSSHTWERVASSLAAQGYFVTAPNLVGHGFRVSADYSLNSITEDLRPYLEARNYSLIMGHSLGALTVLALHKLLPQSHPTAIILIDPPLKLTPDAVSFYDNMFTESCVNRKHSDAYCAENPLWKREDGISLELGRRLCSVDAIHGISKDNNPWDFVHLLGVSATLSKWKVTALVGDPALFAVCSVDYFEPFPHIRAVKVPGVGHCIHYDAADVVVEEALKTVAELETACCCSMTCNIPV